MAQILLLTGLLFCVAYAYLQRSKSRLIALGIGCISLIGAVFVVKPDLATSAAVFLGIGRGADLILYFWVLFSIFIMMSLQFKIFALQRTLTKLAREVAIRTAHFSKENVSGVSERQ